MVSLKNLNEARDQDIFDQVVVHLFRQGKKSVDLKSGFCAYRSVDTDGRVLKCAAGCLIADDEYQSKFDVIGGWVMNVRLGNFNANHKDLINDLQTVHDVFDRNDWYERLRLIANIWNINSEILLNYKYLTFKD
jgi:hypothetical protein